MHDLQFIPPSQPTTPGRQLPTSIPLPVLPAVEAAKRLAAFAAVDHNIGIEQKVQLALYPGHARGSSYRPGHWNWIRLDSTVCGR